MENADLSRRALLQAIAAAIGAAAVPFNWETVIKAAEQAHDHPAARVEAGGGFSFFAAAEAADVEAVAAQIIPTDDSPGAREAGVVRFIDRALTSFFAQLGDGYRAQLAGFQADFRAGHPGIASFAALP